MELVFECHRQHLICQESWYLWETKWGNTYSHWKDFGDDFLFGFRENDLNFPEAHFKHIGIALFDLISILMAFFISLETFESFTELPFHVVFQREKCDVTWFIITIMEEGLKQSSSFINENYKLFFSLLKLIWKNSVKWNVNKAKIEIV